MILRKTPSVFLRALRSVPQEKLPRLPEKKLSAHKQRRLEDAVFARIAEEQNRTVFDEDPAAHSTAPDDAFAVYDSPYKMTVIGERGAWKRYIGSVLAACLCFAVLVTAVLYRHDIAMYFTERGWIAVTDTDTDHEDTQAIHEWTTDEALLSLPPDGAADDYHMQVISHQAEEHQLTLQLRLTSSDGTRFEGIAVQYGHVALELWDPGVRRWILKYEDTIPHQPTAQIMAGDLHFDIHGLGAVNEAEMTLSLPMDLTDYQGVWRISLDGMTMVRDAKPGEEADYSLVAEPLCEGVVWALFSSEEAPASTERADAQTLPPRDTVTPPPQSAHRPLLATDDYSLLLSDTKVKDDTVTLELVLQTPGGKPDGYAIYYETCEIDLWNHEKQVWEGKFGTDSVDVPFEKMLLAGDVQFVVDRYSENTYASLSYDLPHDGWFRLTLTGLVLVREAREGEEAEYNLVTETLDEGAVWVVFYKE